MTPEDVRDLFERALRAKKDLDHMRYRLEALKSPTLSSGIPQAIQGGKSDPTAIAGSALADETDETRRMALGYRSIIEEVSALISGTRRGLGVAYGDVLEDRYIRGYGYDTVAQLSRISRTTAIRYRDIAFDWIASVGPARAKAGEPGTLADPRTE